MVTPDDVAAAIQTRCAATAAVAAAIPGGVWYPAGPDAPAAYPYAVLKVEAGEARLTSGDLYTQPFTAKVSAYVPVGAGGCDPAAVSRALADALAVGPAAAALRAAPLRNPGERVLHARPLAPSGENAPESREGRDVFRAGLAVELLVQGNRGVA